MKHILCFVMVALLYNGAMHPAFNVNLSKELIQKGTGWVASTVPWWVPWVSAVFVCGFQWQRYYNKWEASEKAKEELKRKTEQDVQKQQSWKKVCEDLGIENPNAIVQGRIQIKPKVMVLIDSEYNVFTPGTDKTDPELVINSASGQKLYLKHVVGQNEKPIIRVENRMIQVSGNFLKSIGTYPVKIFDEETNSIVDHTVKFDVPPTNDV